jgi:hypothetical protein
MARQSVHSIRPCWRNVAKPKRHTFRLGIPAMYLGRRSPRAIWFGPLLPSQSAKSCAESGLSRDTSRFWLSISRRRDQNTGGRHGCQGLMVPQAVEDPMIVSAEAHGPDACREPWCAGSRSGLGGLRAGRQFGIQEDTFESQERSQGTATSGPREVPGSDKLQKVPREPGAGIIRRPICVQFMANADRHSEFGPELPSAQTIVLAGTLMGICRGRAAQLRGQVRFDRVRSLPLVYDRNSR